MSKILELSDSIESGELEVEEGSEAICAEAIRLNVDGIALTEDEEQAVAAATISVVAIGYMKVGATTVGNVEHWIDTAVSTNLKVDAGSFTASVTLEDGTSRTVVFEG